MASKSGFLSNEVIQFLQLFSQVKNERPFSFKIEDTSFLKRQKGPPRIKDSLLFWRITVF